MHVTPHDLSRTLPTVIFAMLCAMSPGAAATPKYRVLHAFAANGDGATLWGSLVLDAKGNAYGTTAGGGVYSHGTVFKLTPHSNGQWTEQLLHSFQNNGSDGTEPSSTLVFDGAGNLYGTTPNGGNKSCGYGCGVAFELTPSEDGWDETVVYSFPLPSGDCCPYAGMIMDNAGNLYGTAGDPFELSPGSGGWQPTVLYDFTCSNRGPCAPFAGVIMDPPGNLYGTTERGGAHKAGTAYELTPSSDGWKEQILHSFPSSPSDGQVPGVGALALDASGRVYGTTDQGGANMCGDVGCGTIFRLAKGASGRWKETILYNFSPNGGGAGGVNPGAGVVLDRAGNLFGTTIDGGTGGCGVIYKLAPQAKGKWKYAVLHTFTGYDGCGPDANLILDSKGNLYGTTPTGGAGGFGVAFELTP